MSKLNSLSVVVPVFNEERSLEPLFNELRAYLAPLGRDWEVLFVDDCSADASLDRIRQLAAAHPQVSYISFAANRGQSAAFAVGFQAARGEIIITIDADLQNDPADIPAMLRRFDEGYDMVTGWRASRQDTWPKRLASRLANAVRNALTAEQVRDTGCSLKLMRGAMVRSIPMFAGMHRFLPTLMRMEGAKVAEMKVRHRPRRYGSSKYSAFGRIKTVLPDLLAVMWMQRRYIRYEIKERSRPGDA